MHPQREQHERDNARQGRRYLRTSSAQWRAIRKAQLERFPLCAHCNEPANEVDHIEGDTSKNIIGVDLASLCKPCHSAKTARDEHYKRTGVALPVKGCDANGYPIDPRHHWNEKSPAGLGTESAAHPSRTLPRIGPT